MAGTTGLEPAASAVTGQRSNQLNYVPNLLHRLAASVAGDLFLLDQFQLLLAFRMVGSAGLEPAASCL
jgi:hypothetical protein